MQPHLVALALQADGWILRSEIIWHKKNPMPESVRDRPTKAHETVFLLTKAKTYYYDAEAIKEPTSPKSTFETKPHDPYPSCRPDGVNDKRIHARLGHGSVGRPAGRNRRTVWTIPTSPFPGAHFATFPLALIEPMILTSPTKCCAVCGKGWRRVTSAPAGGSTGKSWHPHDGDSPLLKGNAKVERSEGYQPGTTLGFRPGCECNLPPWVPTPRQGKDEEDEVYAERLAPVREGQRQLMAIYRTHEDETVPAVMCDPFLGSGTSIMVALRHSRNAIGLELSEEYAAMARKRIVDDSPMFNGPLT